MWRLSAAVVACASCATPGAVGPSEPPRPSQATAEQASAPGAPMSAEAVRAVLEAELLLQGGDAPGAIRLLKEAVLFDPTSTYLHVRLAEAHLDAGDAEQAAIAARAALALDPRSAPALRVVGAAQALTGDSAAARRSFERALELDPTDRQAATALTELLVEQGDVQSAERVVERLMDAEPNAVDGYVALGRIFADRGDVQRAFKHLERAAERDALDVDALQLQLSLLEALGRFDEAAQVAVRLARALGDTAEVRREMVALAALAGHADDAEAMARAWLDDDNSEGMHLLVAGAWQRAGELERAAAALARSTGPRVQVERAAVALTLRRLDAARTDACAAAAASSDSDTEDLAAALCARALSALARDAEAITLLLQRLERRPDSVRLLSAIGALLHRPARGVDGDLVVRLLVAAHQRTPHDVDVITTLSRAWEDRGDSGRARAVFDDALRARPSDPDLLFALARFLDRQGQSIGAAEIVERLLERGRHDVDTLNFVAFALADARSRPEDARRFAWRALLLDPLNGYVVDTLGWAMFAAGDIKGALPVLQRADRLSPNEAEVLFHLASVQHALADDGAARALAQRGVTLADDDERVRQRLQALLATLGPTGRDSGT